MPELLAVKAATSVRQPVD